MLTSGQRTALQMYFLVKFSAFHSLLYFIKLKFVIVPDEAHKLTTDLILNTFFYLKTTLKAGSAKSDNSEGARYQYFSVCPSIAFSHYVISGIVNAVFHHIVTIDNSQPKIICTREQ